MGYESAVLTIARHRRRHLPLGAVYEARPPIFVAYGVAMAGIGMLTLTGNTISMDVFGPVADNANGIGEMGYDKEEMERTQPGSYKRARQILADLDAVGNTTKAETKGIAIGSAVIAAVSLFSSFIAVIAVGSEDKIGQMTAGEVLSSTRACSPSPTPMVLIGFLIGGAVPFLFSSLAHPRRRKGRLQHRQRVPRPVPRSGDLEGHEEARLRPGGEHLHRGRPEGTHRPRPPRHHAPRSSSASSWAPTPWAVSSPGSSSSASFSRSSWPTPAAPGTTPRR